MYSLGYYQGNGTLITSQAAVTFDTTTGYAVFNNLAITKSGMYLISIKVFTPNQEYNLNCYSNPITIRSSTVQAQTYDSSSTPDYSIKFDGNYSAINPNEIIANVYNYINSYGVNVNGIKAYAGSVYVVFYSSDSNPTLINTLIAQGINVSSALKFVSASVNGVTYTCSNCSSIIINANNNSVSIDTNSNANSNINSNSNSDSAVINSQVVSAAVSTGVIVGAVVGGIALIIGIIFGYLGYMKLKKMSN